MEIIVIDNASSDSSPELIARFKGVKLLKNSKNLGYAAGTNAGIAYARGKYVCTLNNDLIVDCSWLSNAIEYLEADEQIGIVSSRQMNYFQKDKIDGLYHILNKYLIFEAFGHGRAFETASVDMAKPGFVIGANGASAVYRKEVLHELGGFDERFYAYHEDADICMRALYSGWRCAYVPAAITYHHESASFVRDSELFVYFFERNRWWFIYKNFPAQMILKQLLWLTLMEARIFRAKLVSGYAWNALLRARRDAAIGLFTFREDRKRTLANYKKYANYLGQLFRHSKLHL